MSDPQNSSSVAAAAATAQSLPRFEPAGVLGVGAAVTLIVGIVVGAGIFKAPAMVAEMAGSAGWMFAAWVLGALISLVGALCYAELATAYPHAGGDYHYLGRAYGRSVSFLFGWARLSVITTGSLALLAFVFGDYMHQLLPLGRWGPAFYAAAAVLVLWGVNSHGLRAGTQAQNWLTALEVGGLLLLVVAALWLVGATPATGAPVAAGAPVQVPSLGAFGLAMVFVLLTFGGWNEAAYISAEMRSPSAMVRALVLAILAIAALYLLVTWAYWRGLGLQALARSEAPAADLARVAFGMTGETLISVLVAVAAVTSMNATMIVGARTGFALGRDWPALHRLGFWDARRGTPANAMHLQNLVALGLVVLGAVTGGGFSAMVEFTAPVFWLFFLLTGVALFVLRVREPRQARPFRVPLYPVLPLVFCASCAYMLWASLSYVSSQSLGGLNAAWIGVAVLSLGVLLLVMLRLWPAPAAPASQVRS